MTDYTKQLSEIETPRTGMVRVSEFDLDWEIDPKPTKGQLGLLRENHYRQLFANADASLRPTDVWLDIGANIGSFAVRAAPLVREVIACEPEPIVYEQLKINAALNGAMNIYALKAAVIAGRSQWVDLSISKTFSSTHRLGRIRGRKTIEVAGININETIDMYKINKVKIDCESCEAEILEAMNFEPIEEIVFEYHFSMLKDSDWSRFYAILKRLKDAGFSILKQPASRSKTWHCIVWVKKL
jgi:FkbM family methyltransferase